MNVIEEVARWEDYVIVEIQIDERSLEKNRGNNSQHKKQQIRLLESGKI